jgi:hypothetical protein
MGMLVSIYRSDYDSTRNLFHGCRRLVVTNVDGPFDPSPDTPAAILDRGPFGDPIIVPDFSSFPADRPAGPMYGGTFASTSDSRWCAAVKAATGHRIDAVRIHDRFDTWDDHYALTR